MSLASLERAAAADFVEGVLRADARVSVYLYQPVGAEGVRAESPGVLWDIGPLPHEARDIERGLLYTCAEAGRTGSFLQSAEDCTRRVPQTTRIDADASESFRHFNGEAPVREAQIRVEEARHCFRSPRRDGPPVGNYIHHLALAPAVHDFATVSSGRLPVLGTIFTVTEEPEPVALHEYSNLVDYAIFLAGEVLEIRATHLLGRSHLGTSFEGSALEALLDAPASDASVQLVAKLLFAHHWFFPYDAAAHGLLVAAAGSDEAADRLYVRHGWTPPRRTPSMARDERALRDTVVGDLVTLIRHLAWYRLGKEFRPRPGAMQEAIARALHTALLLLVGTRASVPARRALQASRSTRGGDLYLGPPAPLVALEPDAALVAPVFPQAGIHALLRHDGGLDRFDLSYGALAPGDTGGHTRTHLKPTRFIEGFERGGAPRFSTRTHEQLREQTRWLCSYAIARLAETDRAS